MNAILELSVDPNVLERAEIYAKNSKKTISQLVEEYLTAIAIKDVPDNALLSPITSQIAAIIGTDETTEYKTLLANELAEKYS